MHKVLFIDDKLHAVYIHIRSLCLPQLLASILMMILRSFTMSKVTYKPYFRLYVSHLTSILLTPILQVANTTIIELIHARLYRHDGLTWMRETLTGHYLEQPLAEVTWQPRVLNCDARHVPLPYRR